MTLPAWLEPLLDAEEMRAVDAWAIAHGGVPGLELMERAGAAVARVAERRAPEGRIVVVAGRGNNGGDGFVVARLLRAAGREVDVLAPAALEGIEGDAAANLDRLPGPAPRAWEPEALDGAALIVDALLGTGASGAPRGAYAEAVRALDRSHGVPVLAVDVPSGVDAASGAVPGAAVRATETVSFHRGKVGLWVSPGKERVGALTLADIGIPDAAPPDARAGLIATAALAGLPGRSASSSKFDSGSVLVVGGSAGLTGAPCLTAEAAQRAGAGYVTACVPGSLALVFEMRLLEVMTVSLPDAGGALTAAGAEVVLGRADRTGAVVIGPGAGRATGTEELIRRLGAELAAPVVLDADGLNAHAGRLGDLSARSAPAVLTPHPGELGRLLGVDSSRVQEDRLGHVREAARLSDQVVVLKGDDTLVARPDGLVAVSPGGAPALATAGTGDVLSGLIGALLAKRVDPFRAACAGVLGHVRAGRLAAEPAGPDGVIARDVIGALPRALRV